MEKKPNSPLRSKFASAAALVLIAQAALFYSASSGEKTPNTVPLLAIPTAIGNWHMVQEGAVEKEVQDVLKADDLLNRTYANGGTPANLFIAFFKSQRYGQAPHSPKNCLPGSGWQPSESGTINVAVPGGTINVNHYLVARGDNESLVLYWYQSQGRVVADEFAAKFYLVSDSIRKHRSDAALVRVVVPIMPGPDKAAARATAEKAAADFVTASFPVVSGYLPH
jgi:EpsI family protein